MSGEVDLPKALWRKAVSEYLRVYHRHDVMVDAPIPDEPSLFVCNHGFGGLVDLNVISFYAALLKTGNTRPVTFLVHQLAWTMGVGGLIERGGGRPASREAAEEANAAGHHVVVFPGGDFDASKSWADRNNIVFSGRSGFAVLAQELQMPIVPVVTAGAGESLFVLTNGAKLARTLGLDKVLRLKALPVSLSFPWGLSIGVTGVAPYLPLPTKLATAVLPAVDTSTGESPEELSNRVVALMQARLDDLTRYRLPVLG